MWCGIPPDSRILDSCCCISLEKSSLECSKRAARDIGRMPVFLPIPFQVSHLTNEPRPDVGVVMRWAALSVGVEGDSSESSKGGLVESTPSLIFSISSVSQTSWSTSSGKSPSSPSVSSQESGSLKILSAMALPGMLLREPLPNGEGDSTGESRTSRSG